MTDAKKQSGKREKAKDAPELRFAGVEFKPAPDAQDRLRRLFTILAGHFAEKDEAATGQERHADNPPGGEGGAA